LNVQGRVLTIRRWIDQTHPAIVMGLVILLFLIFFYSITQWRIFEFAHPQPYAPILGEKVNFQDLMALSGYRAFLRYLSLVGAIGSLLTIAFGLGYIWTRTMISAIWKVLWTLLCVVAIGWTVALSAFVMTVFGAAGTDLIPIKTIQDDNNRYHLVHADLWFDDLGSPNKGYAVYKCDLADVDCDTVYEVSYYKWGSLIEPYKTPPSAELVEDEVGIMVVMGDERTLLSQR
jgi:hypothetical protein